MFVIRQIQCDGDQRESITVKQEERIVSIELPLEHEDHEPFRTWKETKQMEESLTFYRTFDDSFTSAFKII